ncbi:HU family DNA-binding protein (plasmid) [Ralstonia pseudosolanacearum]
MNRQDLIDAIAAQTEASKAATGRFLDSFIEQVQKTVAAGDAVKLTGFGTFEKSAVSERAGRNPRTGEIITIPPTSRPKFTPGQTFKDVVKG